MQSKPYDSESLKRMIEEEITVLERQSSKVARRGGDYQSRVQQLHEYLGVDIRNAA
jgi:hypothetical protein